MTALIDGTVPAQMDEEPWQTPVPLALVAAERHRLGLDDQAQPSNRNNYERTTAHMIDDEALRVMVHHAIDVHAARYRTRHVTASRRDTWGADDAWRTYLECIALALGGRYPFDGMTDDGVAAWRTLLHAVDRILSQAATPLQEPDFDTTVRELRALATINPTAGPPAMTDHPPTIQERILAAATDAGHRAGCQVSVQPQYANTGSVYFTPGQGFTPRVTLRYRFNDDYCSLHFAGPGIDALGPREFGRTSGFERPVPGRAGGELVFHYLRYVDGERIEAMLTMLGQALAAHPAP